MGLNFTKPYGYKDPISAKPKGTKILSWACDSHPRFPCRRGPIRLRVARNPNRRLLRRLGNRPSNANQPPSLIAVYQDNNQLAINLILDVFENPILAAEEH